MRVKVLPSGTVTFLFSDIEGSTVRWDRDRAAMQAAVRLHDDLMRSAIAANGGVVFKTIGDAFCAAFGAASQAVAGALEAQRALAARDWSAVGGLRVRMALHTGIADERDDDYFGPTVNRVARLLAIGHGAQVLISGATASLLQGHLAADSELLDLGTHRLKDLSAPERVFQLRVPGLPQTFPPLKSLDAPNNLPAQATPLLGRDEEVGAIAALLAESRVVTVIGPGGIGKTRTAVQVAAEASLDDGAWFVDLASIDDPGLVAGAIATVLNVADDGSAPLPDRLVAALQTKQLLLVLDNCEHVVAEAARIVDRLVQSCSKLRVLSTSREPLAVVGESIFRMPALAIPPESVAVDAAGLLQYGAAALFVARAKAAQQNFTVTDQNAGAIAGIVRRLDGIALAIELAAPRLKVLNLAQLAQRLDDQLKLLTGGSRNALPRQQTLRALIAWSYDLLAPAERRAMRRAGIFRGSWTLEAAEAVLRDEADGADVLDLVAALVDKSLIAADASLGDEPRYRLLESTRAYALERLAEEDDVDDIAARHRGYYAELTRRHDDAYWRSDHDEWAALVRLDLDNVRAALASASAAADWEAAATIAGALRRLWDGTARREGRAAIAAALADAPLDAPHAVRARLDLAAVVLKLSVPEGEPATDTIAALAHDEDLILRAEALSLLGSAAMNAGELDLALDHYGEALPPARTANAPRLVGYLLSSSAYCRMCAGDAAAAARDLDEAAPIIRRTNDAPALARLQIIRAELYFAEGETAKAIECAREAEHVFRERRDEGALFCTALLNLAAYRIAEGELTEAWPAAREALELAQRRDDAFIIAVGAAHAARLGAERGDVESAARLTGFVDASYERMGAVREPTEKKSYDRTIELLESALPGERLASLRAEGAALDQDAAVAEALLVVPA